MMMLLPMVANADAVEINGIFYNLIAKLKEAEVTSNPNKYQGSVIIPESISYDGTDYMVNSIGFGAFNNCRELTSVDIPNSIKSIGISAFNYCLNLESVNIPNNVTNIGNSAFSYCKKLSSVIIPNSVTSLGEDSFRECSSLTKVSIGNGVTKIESYTFGSCTALISVDIPNSVKTISSSAFNCCKSLASLVIPNSVTSIGDYAFNFCTALTSIIIPDSITYISSGMFAHCSGLSSVTIPNSVTHISNSAFEGCSGLSTIDIGSGVEGISSSAFASCPNLTDVFCHAKDVPVTSNTAFQDSYIDYATLHVPTASVNLYKESEPWKNFKNIVRINMPEHTLTYIVDEEVYKTYHIEEGETITPEPAPIKKGYTFSGWSEIPETMPDHDVTVTGTFSINKYKLTYTVDGTEYKTYEVEYGATISPEAEPTKEGYTFSGWSEIPETMPAHDVTVTGSFNINKYKLTYIIDGEEYKSYEVEYGAIITPEPQPEGEYVTFEWVGEPETMPAHDVIVTAIFTTVPKEKCAKPIISYANGKLSFTSDTEGAQFISDITDADIKRNYDSEISLTATYNISVYATKDGYNNSDVATATLCWIDAEPFAEGTKEAEDAVTEVKAIPVLILVNDGMANISGVPEGALISIYDTSGCLLGASTAVNGTTKIKIASTDKIVIVKIGDKTVKVRI